VLKNTSEVVLSLERNKINTMVLIGGWDAYAAAVELEKLKSKFDYLKQVSIVLVPGFL
jgi:6-phosphofructokinase